MATKTSNPSDKKNTASNTALLAPNVPKNPTTLFQKRFDGAIASIREKYFSLYGHNEHMLNELVDIVTKAFHDRKADLRAKDLEKESCPEWYLSQETIAVSLYVDLFADNLKGMQNNISYLKELGVNFIHFMPLLRSREGMNDGGFAVSSYSEINPKLGTMKEFEVLNDLLRKEGISTCIDFVANHTAKEHEWATKARAGDKKYQDMYLMFDNYDTPAEFEKHLTNTFPELAPGNFTYQNDLNKWVFTTFYEFQWDLNYKNPFTLNSIIKEMLFLLNRGVNVIRVDAIRHIWKEIGTNCSNLPQVHIIIAIMKTILQIVCPGAIFLGEAITSQKNVLEYFGTKDKGCELMYNVTLMTSLWSTLATRDVRYMRYCIENSPHLPAGVNWLNYIRCHDDADFIIEDNEIHALGLNSFWHKQFLIDFFIGRFPGSFSRGEIYSYDERTKNARVAGTLASMCGLEKGLYENDRHQVDYAYRRILLLYGVLLAYNGIPIIYSGDEIATLNQYHYKIDREKAIDSRWLHRSKFDWNRAKLRHNVTTSEGTIFHGLKKLIQTRKDEPLFDSSIPLQVFDTWNNHVFGFYKNINNNNLILLANFSEHYQAIDVSCLKHLGFNGDFTDLLHNKKLTLESPTIYFNPYEFFWLKQ